ncbi:hypothetical protein [Salinibacterium sp. ZJ77]|uniref:hypothetical protein n=1 Tax=Salinibacterium sp. ZJ77 TaxID=2708337 RepID=UPI001FBAAF50|nr:hypothetical protein [Salinibacterium sp. ZJ77]
MSEIDTEIAEISEPAAERPAAGVMRIFRGNRTLWIVAAAAALSLVAGLLVGRFVVSPADAAAGAQAPAPGLITVPVEFGALSNDVTIRADVGYADAVDVTLDTSGISGPAVVTGQVPKVGDELGPLSVAMEVAGRPVIVLPGELPSYRSLRFGVSGPDVVQLKQALAAVGIDPGDVNSNLFDARLAAAIDRLYDAVGYAPPESQEGADDAVRAAQDAVRGASQAITSAQKELQNAQSGASVIEIAEADNAVASAQRQLDAALAEVPQDALQVADLRDALQIAQLRRAQLNTPPDTSAAQAALTAARAQHSDAVAALQSARNGALTTLPAGEVLFLQQLPRRVDAVNASRGTILQGVAMTVSGAELRLSGSAAEAEARLLEVGATATFEASDGTQLQATVSKVEAGKAASDRWTVELTPVDLTPDQFAELQGRNVRVSIPVGATEGDVLSVPLAALTAGPGGESRIEIVTGDPRDGEKAETRVVVVETGLAAGGYVEITPVGGDTVEEGDLVVVGS